ncbi:UDP-N-acetylmuramoyl-L-alanine--D-glutamate ligase [Chitinimonas sp. BJB300]|uniref:UDP-N-acetylmuramoyl-L-alanine--D-glutamate ligase n=1 Tax=Chitinimonas sp. BJB300 TaxID=1559339 RepID=UPI000C0C7E21|nr:UDP-N-acetylmuramoyl-L-alanine--D-glutamate ligase [Chitinimonas sp. BJB300]PHV12772.1 UDP-N-acetylmuramoyl-L-alanine--D-glutamate ligase [Chitinimonas sp. BJB300]TSJ91358.1 UDP-N-acetylmuramoyl-L-alanine--D-glutamate ligase [Chitinimonas sp. BJB300]
MHLAGKHITVVGLGITGLSAAKWLSRHGAVVSVADSRDTPPALADLRALLPQIPTKLGAFSDSTFTDAELLVVSPGVPLSNPYIADAIERGVEVMGDIELFARAREVIDPKSKVIAITGSNGKSTVTSMVGAMCETAGLNTIVAGNIGTPVLDVLTEIETEVRPKPDVWVLELSSFQLETTVSLAPDAAAVLNVSEDHLDRYDSILHYSQAKARVFEGLGAMVLNREDGYCRGMARPGRQVFWFGLDTPRTPTEYGLHKAGNDYELVCGDFVLMLASELPLAGLHNAANALSALALTRSIGLPTLPLVSALKRFKGLPHRVEFVAEVKGVRYYDDSKGTNVGATEAALKGMNQPVVLIAGGDGKGQDFSPLATACKGKVRSAILIGRDGPQIRAALANTSVKLIDAGTMDEAVQVAAQEAQAGDAVLMSPACASFDMFKNYAHRAEMFISAVRTLGND